MFEHSSDYSSHETSLDAYLASEGEGERYRETPNDHVDDVDGLRQQHSDDVQLIIPDLTQWNTKQLMQWLMVVFEDHLAERATSMKKRYAGARRPAWKKPPEVKHVLDELDSRKLPEDQRSDVAYFQQIVTERANRITRLEVDNEIATDTNAQEDL